MNNNLKYSWYEQPKIGELDYQKPIVAQSESGSIELLLPQINCDQSTVNTFEIFGFNWFNLATGRWNSCRTWETPQAAVADRKGYHKIYNAKITVTPLER